MSTSPTPPRPRLAVLRDELVTVLANIDRASARYVEIRDILDGPDRTLPCALTVEGVTVNMSVALGTIRDAMQVELSQAGAEVAEAWRVAATITAEAMQHLEAAPSQ